MRALQAAVAAMLTAGVVSCGSSEPARAPGDTLAVAAAPAPAAPSVAPREVYADPNAYVAVVRKGNQLPIGKAAVPFARYLNAMHNRLHPVFTGTYIASLGALPRDDPQNDQHLKTSVEIVLDGDGRIHRMGLVARSGVPAFDAASLDAFDRAQPYGAPPSVIRSRDGFLYVHWDLYRDDFHGCSTMNARPFLLKVPPPDGEATTAGAPGIVSP